MRRGFSICSMTVAISLAAGCHALRWPWWGEHIDSGPESVAGSGRARLAPKPGAAWPVRIAFRVRPGAFGALEVRGDQRVVMPIAPEGGEVRDLELAPGVYTSSTQTLEIGWSPHSAPDQSPGG
jgi:hypothetical protein